MASPTHDFTATEIKAGTLVLVSVLILAGFVAAMRGCRPRDETARQYFATFTDIGGLNTGADVRFGGVRVGKVVAIAPDSEDRSRIRVQATVRGDVPVNLGSVASIEQVTLTTEKHLEISTGSAEESLHASGDTIRSRPGVVGLVDMRSFEGATDRLERLLDDVITLLGVAPTAAGGVGGDPELVDLARLMATLDETLDESAGTVRQVNTVIGENRAGLQEVVDRLVALEMAATALLEEVNGVVDENRQPLGDAVANLERLTGDASRHVEELATTLQAALRHFEDTGGNASDLLDDQRPALEAILRNLQETTRHLSVFARTLAEHPGALIRSTGPQGREAEEGR